MFPLHFHDSVFRTVRLSSLEGDFTISKDVDSIQWFFFVALLINCYLFDEQISGISNGC